MPMGPRLRSVMRPYVHAARRRRHPARWGNLHRREPFSRNFGFDRGTPIDRYYIDRFLQAHQHDVAGDVLEVLDDTYTRRFGDESARPHVVDFDADNPRATIIGDIADPATLPDEAFDCAVVTQTLQYLPSPAEGVAQLWRSLRPGGVLLVSVPLVAPLDEECLGDEQWRFTVAGLRSAMATVSPDASVRGFGNLVAATAWLQGLAAEDLRPRDLNDDHPRFHIVAVARAVKPVDGTARTAGPSTG
jgi:SAM-dependent methyltransferase